MCVTGFVIDTHCIVERINPIKLRSRVDYYNAVLYGVSAKVTRRLQMVLNAAVRLVVGTGKYDHITRMHYP